MTTDTTTTGMVEFVCRECPRPLGRAQVERPAEWLPLGESPPERTVIDYRNDPSTGYVSDSGRRRGGPRLRQGRNFNARTGESHAGVPHTGRQTWERVEVEGVMMLAWRDGCGCGRKRIGHREADILQRIDVLRDAGLDPVQLPV